MKPYRLTRTELTADESPQLVLAQDVRDAAGRVVAPKGSRLTSQIVERLRTNDWSELHAAALEPGDVHEFEAGARLARAVAGRDVDVGAMTAGHWPLVAAVRGVLHVDVDALRDVNALPGIALYTLFDGQVVEQKEIVARGKIVPFAIPEDALASAERIARSRDGTVHVRRFVPFSVGAIIQESLGDRAMTRAHAVLAEKLGWFGSTLLAPCFVSPRSTELAQALRAQMAQGAQLLVVAGSRPMDPLDPMYEALDQIDARIERQGMPAHPGSLLWVGYAKPSDGVERTIVGLPSCGLFSQASVFDLLMPKLLTGERLTNKSLAELGHGGLLTRDMQFRFPPYRSGARRGEVLEE
ncbi:MAG TPA: hypothetical protein VGQ52_03115 [Gemmatimonadaceae bacterium]|nr:hypothetical protein [Gemmatimonadaceae bacterium]